MAMEKGDLKLAFQIRSLQARLFKENFGWGKLEEMSEEQLLALLKHISNLPDDT